jgi:hypothetical protein
MTLKEYADFIGGKLGKTDSESLTKIKGFIKARHKMIFDAALWRDAMAVESVAATAALIVLPAAIGRVVSVRWNDSELPPMDMQTAFQIMPDTFDQAGTPVAFAHAEPIATKSAIGTAEKLRFTVASSGDAAKTVFIRGLISGSTDLRSETVALVNPTVDSANSYAEVHVLAKDATTGTVTISGVTSATAYGAFMPHQTVLTHPRIRLINPPADTSKLLLVLYKRRCEDLISDYDAPILRGIDNALIAYAMADALEWMRQFGKAQVKAEEGAAQMEILRDNEKHQQSTHTRIVPWVENGGGWPYF